MSLLYIVSLPLNLTKYNFSINSINVMKRCDFLIGEERKTIYTLIHILDLGEKKYSLLNEHTTEKEKIYILQRVKEVNCACLFSDIGTVAVADPGYDFINICYENGINILSLPGPSSITTALSLSGFYAERFYFTGYPPRDPKEKQLFFDHIAKSKITTVIIERPYAMKNLIKNLEKIKDKRMCITYNLGTENERIIRGFIDDIREQLVNMPKAPFVVVLEGKDAKSS